MECGIPYTLDYNDSVHMDFNDDDGVNVSESRLETNSKLCSASSSSEVPIPSLGK